MPDDILTAEQVLALFRNEDISWMSVAAQLERSHERLREQRDKGMKREADFIKKWADAEDRLARTKNEAKRQFEEWAEHLRACGKQCEAAETRLARVTDALEQIPCQMVMTVEDCNVAVAQHVRRHERYEKLPRSEWCVRCAALAAATDDSPCNVSLRDTDVEDDQEPALPDCPHGRPPNLCCQHSEDCGWAEEHAE